MTVDAWLEALPARHAGAMKRSEFLKAIRALSARYVERRGALPDRSPLDSAGKRAAFAGFYAPLHFLTTRAILAGLGAERAALNAIVDAGCGTGVCGAAWALSAGSSPALTGIDLSQWALDEAQLTWRDLGLRGRTKRGDLAVALAARVEAAVAVGPARPPGATILGWSLNELEPGRRIAALRSIDALAAHGTRVLAIEPIAGRLVPWWSDWAERCTQRGARSGEWRVTDPLPPALAQLDRDAGFNREGLTARSVAWNW